MKPEYIYEISFTGRHKNASELNPCVVHTAVKAKSREGAIHQLTENMGWVDIQNLKIVNRRPVL